MPVYDMIEYQLVKRHIPNGFLTRLVYRTTYIVLVGFIAITLPFFGGACQECLQCYLTKHPLMRSCVAFLCCLQHPCVVCSMMKTALDSVQQSRIRLPLHHHPSLLDHHVVSNIMLSAKVLQLQFASSLVNAYTAPFAAYFT